MYFTLLKSYSRKKNVKVINLTHKLNVYHLSVSLERKFKIYLLKVLHLVSQTYVYLRRYLFL